MEDDDYAEYGTPLEPLDEENFRTQKAPRIQDQIVTDAKGKRRFHGAFTGGFSAGYFNSAGSKDGWTPSTFVSSRSKKSESKSFASFNPRDFMDDEDLRDQGIDPESIRATSSFDTNFSKNKRKYVDEVIGPIPGKPVLEDLLRPSSETMGIKLLKKLGWRPGQGIGPRISKRDKLMSKKEQNKFSSKPKTLSEDSESDENDYEFSKLGFAPDNVEPINLPAPKSDFFGLGYCPLERTNVLGFLNPSEVSHLKMKDKSKRVSIRGQAFGVGAFEEEDDDIYGKEDMSNYDFAIGEAEEHSYDKTKKNLALRENDGVHKLTDVIEGFAISSKPYQKTKTYALPVIPPDFKPIHSSRRRRFEIKNSAARGLGRHELTVEDRQRILTEPAKVTVEIRSGIKKDILKMPEPELEPELLETFSNIERSIPEEADTSTNSNINFKPFLKNPEKQKRYETYLSFRERGLKDTFHCVQLKSMTDWEKESERREFEMTAALYTPLTSTMSARFTSASFQECVLDLKDGLNDVSKHKLSSKSTFVSLLKGDESDDIMKAAKSKMFGQLTYSKIAWHPINILCRRFNVPNPYPNSTIVGIPNSKKEKVSIFNFLSAPLDQTAGLQTSKVGHQKLVAGSSTNKSYNSRGEGNVKEEDPIDIDINYNKEEEKIPEDDANYGLKVQVPTTGPPTMDLFKAIFADSDSDDSDDSDAKEESSKIPPVNEGLKQDSIGIADSQSLKLNDDSSKVDKTKPTDKIQPSNCDTLKFSKILFVQPPKNNIEAKGVFKNIDFEALNEYRNTQFRHEDPEPKTVEVVDLEKENSSHKSSSESDGEYGPALPPSLLTNTSNTPNNESGALNVPKSFSLIEEKKISSRLKKSKSRPKHKMKKSKKKKHKKEKKKKKDSKHRKQKKYSSSSGSEISSSES